jgi:hypothetical protein
MSGRRFALAVVLLALLGAAGFLLGRRSPAPPRIAGPPAPDRPLRSLAGNPIRTPAEAIAATPDEILNYAAALNTPGSRPHADCQLLVSLLEIYRTVTRGTDPVGDNAEITAVLTGNNRLGYAFIRPDSPAINRDGELCDRWGTPYFFHQISGTQMAVRSAGPDRKLFTSDDLEAGP